MERYQAEFDRAIREFDAESYVGASYDPQARCVRLIDTPSDVQEFHGAYGGEPVYVCATTNNCGPWEKVRDAYVKARRSTRDVLVGIWKDPSGQVFRDVSVVVRGRGNAERLKQQHGQQCVLEVRADGHSFV